MDRIHLLATKDRELSLGELLERFFWHLAPASGALIVILGVVLLNFDFVADAEVWPLLAFESETYSLMQMAIP